MSTWICVQNLNFQYSYDEMKDVFDGLVHPISSKWPSPNSLTSLGFIFLQFSSYQEAQNAIEIIGSSPIHGRKLSAYILTNGAPQYSIPPPQNIQPDQTSQIRNDKPVYPIEILHLKGPTLMFF